MRVFFLGETQTRHIEKIYRANGHDTHIMVFGGLRAKIRNVIEIARADMIYQVFGQSIRTSKSLSLAALLKKKIVIHWIGTDVLEAAKEYEKTGKILNEKVQHVNLACAAHLKDELSKIGIHAEYVPIFPVDISFELLPMPEQHAVLSYIPEGKTAFYGLPELQKLAKRFPDIDFHIVANTGATDTEKLPNIHYHGFLSWEELRNLYKKCSILFRYTKHDGLPVMIIEAMGLGRQVIFSFDFPYAHKPVSCRQADIEETFCRLVSVPPQVNSAGSAYINRQFTLESLVAKYKELDLI